MQLLAGWVDDSDLLGTHCLFVQALDQKTASLAREAAAALTQANAAAVAKGLPSAPLRPGLYDVHAPARVWTELGLGRPPDERPLYVGKAESSLAGRDVTGHPGFTEGGRARASPDTRHSAAVLPRSSTTDAATGAGHAIQQSPVASANRRGGTNVTRKRQAREWDEQHGKLVDLSGFQREILPLIQNIPLSQLQRATGLSIRYVSMIRRGERTPHPRHWQALLRAVERSTRRPI